MYERALRIVSEEYTSSFSDLGNNIELKDYPSRVLKLVQD